MNFSWKLWLAGGIFLFFPLANFRLIPSLPLYGGELFLLVLLGLFSGEFLFRQEKFGQWTSFDKKIIVWLGVFMVGITAAFLFNHLPYHALGLVKSFVLLPLLFAVLLRWSVSSLAEHEFVLSFWYSGLLAATALAAVWVFSGDSTYDGRLSAWYDSPNQLAFLLGPGVLLGIYSGNRSTAPFFQRLFFFGIPLLGIFLLITLTRSYGVMGAVFAAGFLLISFLRKPVNQKLFILGIIGILSCFIIWVAQEYSTEKFQSLLNLDERSSLSSRIMIWTVASRAAVENFPWGIGIGQFQSVYLSYQPYYRPYLEWAAPEPHNLFLAVLLAGGVTSLAAFVICVWIGIKKALFLLKTESNRPLAALYVSLVAYWLLAGVVDTPYFDNYPSLGWWGIFGLIWALYQGWESKKSTL